MIKCNKYVTLFGLCFFIAVFLTGCHTHVFSEATCTEPAKCECGEKKGSPLGHTKVIDSEAKEPTCLEKGVTESSHCSVCGEILSKLEVIPAKGHDVITNPAKEATCTEDGYTEESYCKVCHEVFSAKEIIPSLGGHDIDETGRCTRCYIVDKNSEQYKRYRIQETADKLIKSCAETELRKKLKDPSSLVVLSEDFQKKDDYLRYTVTINYKAKNSFGGYVTSTDILLIRISSKCDGTYYTYDTDYGKKPKDWDLDSYADYTEAQLVTLDALLANPNDYNGKLIKLSTDLVLSRNNIDRKSYSCMKSTGNKEYDYDTDRTLEVFYRLCDNYESCFAVTANHQKIHYVAGYVKIYSDAIKPYIDALHIEGIESIK